MTADVDPDTRCETTELLVTACGCRRHRGAPTPEADPTPDTDTTGPLFHADYDGVCERCDGLIRPDDLIGRSVNGVGYVHATCPPCGDHR